MSTIISFFEKYKLSLISLITVIYFSRMSLPFVKYIFFPLLIITFLFVTISGLKDKKIFSGLTAFITAFSLLIINLIIHTYGIFQTEILNIFIIKEYLNSVTVLILAWVLFQSVTTKESLNIYIGKITKYTIAAGFIIAVISFIKFFLDLKGFQFTILNPEDYPLGTALTNDRNFFSLFGLFSLILILPALLDKNKKSESFLIQFILLALTTSIILTTSRRAILILAFLFIILLLIHLVGLFWRNKPALRNIISNTKLFLSSFTILIASVYFAVSSLGLYKINNTLVKHGFDPDRFKVYTTILTFQLKSLVVSNTSVTDIHTALWMKDDANVLPFSGEGNRVFNKLKRLPKDASVKFPFGKTGIKITSESDFNVANNTAFSYTMVDSFKLTPDTVYALSVMCFVSENFNGNCVMLSTGKNKQDLQQHNYNLKNKGKWQELSILLSADTPSVVPVYLGFSKYHAQDFTDLTGQVTFTVNSCIPANDSTIGLIASKNQIALNTFLYNPPLKKEDLFASADLLLNSSLAVPRIERWRYAWSIFTLEYSWFEKFFGDGFTYMSKFGKKFIKSENILDWPHNPVLSTLLYSGITGVMFYLYFLGMTVYLYWKHSKSYLPITICFLISLFFAVFSGNNSLDPPIMGIFMMFPYLINHIQKRNT